MSLNFLNNLKENLEKNDNLSQITDSIGNFINELAEALKNSTDANEELDIVTQISSSNKLSLASENELMKERINVLNDYAKNNGETFYFILNKVKDEDKYRVWKFSNGKRTQSEMQKDDLPNDANVNSILKVTDGKLVTDKEGTNIVISKIKERADEIIEKQNKKIEDYKKEGHTYLVTEDINGRVFLWDSTEKPSYEIEDVYFPEELKNKAKEGNSFLYQNGTYTHIS